MVDTLQIPNPYAKHRSRSAVHRDESRSGRLLPYVLQPSPPRWPTRIGHRGERTDPSRQELARSIRSAFCRHVTGFNTVWIQRFWMIGQYRSYSERELGPRPIRFRRRFEVQLQFGRQIRVLRSASATAPCDLLLDHLLASLFLPANVLVEMEDVFRIVASFHFQQAGVVWAVGRSDAFAFVGGHEIYIAARGSVGRGRFEECACPLDALIVLLRPLPSAMHVDHDPGIASAVGGGAGGNVVRYSCQQAEEDLAMGRGKFARVFNDRVERSVADFGEVMRLPVIPRSGCQQWVESLLPLGVGHRSHMLSKHISKAA